MMALGLAIGAGFFLGTGSAIHQAGPAVILSYTVAAFIVVSVMLALAELASSLPTTGSFSSYAEAGIGRWAGFTIGWLYWVMLIMVSGLEVTGAATFFVGWFPAVPQWVVALVIVVVIGGINLLSAGQYGEIEAWLSMVKIVAIIAFLCVGVYLVARTAIVGPLPGHEGVWQNVSGHNGFMPNGLSGIAVALLAVITSFGGLEIVTIAAAEAEDPRAAMSSAIRSVVTRILVFYVGSVVLLIALLPWDGEAMKTNAFAAVLEMAGVPAVGTLMNVIIFMALISAFSANIYASSRMAYSLAARDMGPRWLLGAPSAEKAHARAVGDANARRQHVVDHRRELVDALHGDGVAVASAQAQAGGLEVGDGARTCIRPHDVGQHREDAVQVDRVGLHQTVGKQVQSQVGVLRRSGGFPQVNRRGHDDGAHAARVIDALQHGQRGRQLLVSPGIAQVWGGVPRVECRAVQSDRCEADAPCSAVVHAPTVRGMVGVIGAETQVRGASHRSGQNTPSSVAMERSSGNEMPTTE